MAMAMLGKVAMRSLRRSVLAAAATAPRSWARDVPRRLSSSGGNLLAEEGKAAETIYIKKKEEERAQNLAVLKGDENSEASVVPCTATPSIPTSASLTSNPKGRVSMLDLMDHIENNDFSVSELKHALRVIREKCGPDSTRIEMELAREHESTTGANNLPVGYVKKTSKVLRTELERARIENERAREKYLELEQKNSTKNKQGFWDKLPTALSAAIELIKATVSTSIRH